MNYKSKTKGNLNEIKIPFNVGDSVYYLLNDEIRYGRIVSINVYATGEKNCYSATEWGIKILIKMNNSETSVLAGMCFSTMDEMGEVFRADADRARNKYENENRY